MEREREQEKVLVEAIEKKLAHSSSLRDDLQVFYFLFHTNLCGQSFGFCFSMPFPMSLHNIAVSAANPTEIA